MEFGLLILLMFVMALIPALLVMGDSAVSRNSVFC